MQDSRALAVLCIDSELSQAGIEVETIISEMKGNFYHRRDIGSLAITSPTMQCLPGQHQQPLPR